MEENKVEYYNGISARCLWVDLILFEDAIQLNDPELNTVLVYRSFRDCSFTINSNRLFVYLDDLKNSYFVLPEHHPLYILIKDKLATFRKGTFNKLMSVKKVPLLALLLLICSIVYFLFITVVPWLGLKVIPVTKEIALGNRFYTSYISDHEIDTPSTLKVREFAANLKLSNKFPIKVTVVKDSIVNAFALPGGNIIIYTGILNKLNNYDELVALLGHESTHVNERHGMRSLLKRLSGTILYSLILNNGGNITGSILQNADYLRTLSFSRSLEEEADNKGMALMMVNHVDPKGMKNLMLDLERLKNDVPDAVSFISTHPLTKERIKSADNFLRKNSKFKPDANEELINLWLQLKNLLAAAPVDHS